MRVKVNGYISFDLVDQILTEQDLVQKLKSGLAVLCLFERCIRDKKTQEKLATIHIYADGLKETEFSSSSY